MIICAQAFSLVSSIQIRRNAISVPDFSFLLGVELPASIQLGAEPAAGPKRDFVRDVDVNRYRFT